MYAWSYFFIAGAFLLGGLAGALMAAGYASKDECKSFAYINQDIACRGKAVISKAGYAELENDLRVLVEERMKSGEVVDVGIYFRDLHAGPAFGINVSETFTPASLLKLPLVITLFSLEEEIPGLLETKIRYEAASINESEILTQKEAPLVELGEGQIYTVEELMRNSLVYSDNHSYYTLAMFLGEVVSGGREKISRTFQELGIVDPRNIAEEVVTVHGYASLLRILYNVSYLSPAQSELLLSWMAEATFAKGLEAGLPDDIALANKFGERELPDGSRQLHDCGIVYYPENPYILCIMTKGTDWDALAQIIEEISHRVYEEVDSRRL